MRNQCVLCDKEIDGVGANPFPVSYYGECCSACDNEEVVPARLLQSHYAEKYLCNDLAKFIITNLIHLNKSPEQSVKLWEKIKSNKEGK